jgi:uncharacterized protein (DUF1697 family)
MRVIISMLRGVNVGGHNMIKMETLRALYESLELLGAQTYVQSGNVIFRTKERDLVLLTKRIEDGIESNFGFRPKVIVRTSSDLREVIARNPFATRPGIEPSRLLVLFLAGDPGAEAREKTLSIKVEPEELRIADRELYIYYPDGMARPKLSIPLIEKTLKTPATGRNWNTVTKLLALAERLEGSAGKAI